MTFDLERIWASKRAYRQTLAAKPIAEKLRLLASFHWWASNQALHAFSAACCNCMTAYSKSPCASLRPRAIQEVIQRAERERVHHDCRIVTARFPILSSSQSCHAE